MVSSNVFLLLMHVWSRPKSKDKWGGNIIVSLLNLGGDIASVYAYTMTSLSSAQLLVTTVVFWVAPLSFFLFKRKLSIAQIFSILLGILGIIIVFLEDGAGKSKWSGNLVALTSALCYAMSTTLEEKLIHDGDIKVYLYRFGICTTPVSSILTCCLEIPDIKKYMWDATSISLVLLYGFVMAAYYTIVPYIMKHSTATEMNLSFLTSNFFSLFVGWFFFGQKMSIVYFIGFTCVPLAIIIFCLFPPKKENQPAKTSDVSDLLLPQSNNEPVYTK